MQASKTELANKEKNHQKKLLEATLEIAEKERQKIAYNLHDEIGVNFSVLKLNFSKLQVNNPPNENTDATVAVSNAIIEESMNMIRSIANDMRPKTLLSLGLVAALTKLSRQISDSGAAEVNFLYPYEIIIPDTNRKIILYRLLKEVVNNTLRHAKPTFIEINIENKENTLFVIILHDGMGVTTEEIKGFAKNSKGLGLQSIFTRIELLEGSIDYLIESKTCAKVLLKCSLV